MLNILNKLLTILDSLIFVKDWIAILRYTITGFSKEKKINFYFFFQFALIIHLFLMIILVREKNLSRTSFSELRSYRDSFPIKITR